ncbi:MAG: alpha-(1-_3)-arabinofuranosyltransferase family protein, partial [Ilumatobacteraceae bacterium]
MSTGHLTARTSRWSVGLLAALAYLPALLTKPGRMPTDTKLFLYLDPGRLIADAPFTWDTRQFGGWVPHQTIAYLWPQGPWYWVFDKLGAPDWVAHRLWLGTLLLLAACGVFWAARVLGMPKNGALVAAIVYQLSPYILPYVSRTSAMLLPWAAVGWLVGLTIRSVTSEHRWRHPALIALVLLSCSAVNATAVMMIAPAPILWLAHAVLQRTITWRRAVGAALRIGGLGVAVSLWWIFMLRAQGAYGADVLAYSESLQATSLTSASTETLRGMGYWLFYVRDPYAFTTTASQTYMESGRAILISFALLCACVGGLALTRWSQRRYAALLVLAGIVLAVGVHPIDDASPLMSPLAANSRSSLALAIRSSTRALPLSNFGLALGAGALVAAFAATRWRLRSLAPVVVVLLAVVNLPALFDGNLVDPALERDETPPAAWQQAADALSTTSSEYRVLELPGSEFGAFRWGYTVDPPLPGLTTKPLVTRDLLPLGSPGVMDLLYALDDRVQDHTLDPAALAPVSRLLAADTIWVANDLAFDRFRTPRPEEVSALFRTNPEGLGTPAGYGPPAPNTPDIPMLDETALSSSDVGTPLAPVELVPVTDPVAIVRASERVVVLVGSGDGVVDAAAAGLLHGDEAVRYAADLSDDEPLDGAVVIITDSNRDRAHHWRSSQDVSGFTEVGGNGSDVQRIDEGDQRLPVFGPVPDAADQTIATLDDGLVVTASGYGEPFTYRPEQRPSMAVDGDPATAWVVADRNDPVGQFLRVSTTGGTLQLLQPQATHVSNGTPNRMITSVRVEAEGSAPLDVGLDGSSLVTPGQQVQVPANTAITITITAVGVREGGTDTGPSAVGFAELGLGGHRETVRTPITAIAAAPDAPTAVVLTRLRTDPRNRWRSDPEPTLEREFTLPVEHSFDGTVMLRRNDRAPDAVLDVLDHVVGATSDRRLAGVASARGRFATDGDGATAWSSPFIDAVGSTLTVPLDPATPVRELALQQIVDSQHSLITDVRLTVGDSSFELVVPAPDADGRSTLLLPAAASSPVMTLTVTGIEARTTIDRRFGEPTTLPVAISELTSPAITAPTQTTPDTHQTCTTGLLSIDGAAVPLQLDVTAEAALARGETVRVHPCEPLVLSAGTHHLSTLNGLSSGIDVDQVVLDDGVAPTHAAAPTVTLQRTRTSRTATVAPCPRGCWLIMGEGLNSGWAASVDGRSLGAPKQVAGGFNGWWLAPSASPTTVHIDWQVQAPVTVALLLSALAVIACVGLAVGRRRTRAAADIAPRWSATPPGFHRSLWAPVSWRTAAATA